MPDSRRAPSRLRQQWHRLSSTVDARLPSENLSDLGIGAVLMLLVGLLLLFVVREIRDGALTGCPAYDGITHKQEAEALCTEP